MELDYRLDGSHDEFDAAERAMGERTARAHWVRACVFVWAWGQLFHAPVIGWKR